MAKHNRMGKSRTLSTQELRALDEWQPDSFANRRDRVLALALSLTGMRKMEAACLAVGQIYTDSGQVRETLVLGLRSVKEKHTREVPVSPKLARIFAEWHPELQQWAGLWCNRSLSPDDALLPADARGPKGRVRSSWFMSPSSVDERLRALFARLGFPEGLSSHGFRRTVITELARRNVPLKTVMEVVGHRSLAITQGYIDVTDEEKRRAVELL